ncbi:hypothetical protein EV363DRAFT_1456572 [Boletus edulis]|nr:hypothetical protein EV363DRAFT_1456572 [Boletus edulis]
MHNPQSLHMEYMRACEYINEIKIKLTEATVERDTLRNVLNRGAPVHQSAQAIDPASNRPSRASHPHIKFWTRQEYEKFLDTAEGQLFLSQADDSGIEPYLEEEDGQLVSKERVEEIHSILRSGFAGLVNTKHAARTMGFMDPSAHQYLHSVVEEKFPLFRCAKNNWKLDRLATKVYPAWAKHHLNNKLEWKTPEERKAQAEKKRKPKEEASSESLKPAKRQKMIDAKRSEDILEVNEPTGVRDVVAIEQAGELTDDPTPSEKTNELTGVRDVAAIEQAAKSINDSTPLQKMNKPTGVRDVVAIEQAGESTDDPTPSEKTNEVTGVRDVAAIEQAAKSINDSTPSEKTNKPTGVRDVTAIEQAGESTNDPTPSGIRDVAAIEQAAKSINNSTPSEKTNKPTGVQDVAAIEQAAKSINNSTPSEKTNKPTETTRTHLRV